MELDHVFLASTYRKGELYRISAYRTDRRGNGIAAFESKIACKKERESSEYPSREIAFRELVSVLNLGELPVVIVSMDPVRDKRDYAKVFPFVGEIWLDIHQLAWPLVMHTAISKERTLKELCLQFDVPQDGEECVMLSRLYWAMMTRYKTSLFGEEVIRNTGGRALSHIRSFLGV